MLDPQLDREPTREVSGRHITCGTTVREARRACNRTQAVALVVVDDQGVPVGVVTAAALCNPRETASVGEVMDFAAVALLPGANALVTLRAFEAAGWELLLRDQPEPAMAPATATMPGRHLRPLPRMEA